MEEVGSRCDLFIYEGQKHGFFNYRPKTYNKYFFETIAEAESASPVEWSSIPQGQHNFFVAYKSVKTLILFK